MAASRAHAEAEFSRTLRIHIRQSGKLRLQLRIEFSGALIFLARFFGLTLPLQRLRQMKMCRRVGRDQGDGGTELGNGSVQISQAEQPLSGVGIESRGLQIGFVLADLRPQLALPGGAFFITQLAQDGGERGMRSGKIGLQADGLAQGCGGFR